MINDRLTYDADQIIYSSFVFFGNSMYFMLTISSAIYFNRKTKTFRNVLKQSRFHREIYYEIFLHVYLLNMITIDFEYLIYEICQHL